MIKFTLEEILSEVINSGFKPKGRDKVYKMIRGHKIKVNSYRLVNFKVNGICCASCGKAGTHFREHNNNESDTTLNINLFSEDDTMMTTSKVIGHNPTSFIDNYITLCEPCNKMYDPIDRVEFKVGE